MKVRMTKAGSARIKRCRERAKPLCVGCERELVPGEQVRRGLCVACYAAVLKALHEKRIDEAELLKTGKLLPRQKGGRPPVNKFTAELAQRRA